jgi:hypothetical protein
MSIKLSAEEIDFLQQLQAAGERGRTISGAKPRRGMHRLVESRFVTDHAVSMDAVLYVITKRGKDALALAKPA